MAKKNTVLVKLVSTKSGYFYVKKKNPKATTKMSFRKFDPVVRQHVEFKEKKMS